MLDSKIFGFDFFLGGKKKVKDLTSGAVMHGGATRYKDEIISNVETDDFIKVTDDNTIGIFIPSTIEIDNPIDNKEYVKQVINMIRERYLLEDMSFYNTEGSWFDDSSNTVIIEKITIVNLKLPVLIEEDIRYFIGIAQYIKNVMKQKCVSLNINDSLAIVV